MIESIFNRLDRVQKIPPKFMGEILPAPIAVKIELSPRCNYHCKFCALEDRNGSPQKDMDLGLFHKITAEMRDIGVEEIGLFFIGESFMNPDLLINAIRYLKKDLEFPYVFLTSNASIAHPNLVKQCMEEGLDSLKWSCNAADKEQFESMMGVPSINFKRACNNIMEAYHIREENGFHTKLYASSIMYDDQQSGRMNTILSECVIPFVDKHYWLPLYTMATAGDRESGLGLVPVAGNPGRLDDPVAPIPCWLLFTSGHVMADGRLTACGYDSIGTWEVGDLKIQSFMEAWNSPEFQLLRKSHLGGDITETKCKSCLLLR